MRIPNQCKNVDRDLIAQASDAGNVSPAFLGAVLPYLARAGKALAGEFLG